jgi:hypothetical protein
VGLLDDLKREADRAREAKAAEEARRAELENIYRAEIAPRLAGIHSYLTEMVKHLEAVNWVVEAAYDFPGMDRLENLRQGNYRVFVDSHGSPRRVSLDCDCALPAERKFSVVATKADELRQFLIAQNVAFTDWPIRDKLGQVKAIMFQGRLRVRAGLLFEADIETSRIRVVSHNFEGLTTREYLFGYSSIDETWLDELGHYLLRKKTILGSLEISDETRQRLRRLAEEEKARQSRETERAALPGEESKPAEPGLLRGLSSRLFKFDKSD